MVEEANSKIEVKLSKIQFPEVCPVCLEEPEDLVFVTIVEKTGDMASSSWMKQQDKVGVALEAAKGSTTFAVPTCMLHGSKSVRTLRTKIIAAVGFFVMYYPILFFLLDINSAMANSRPFIRPLLGVIASIIILLVFLVYGLFPRALERTLRFHDVNRARNSVLLTISNPEYRSLFLDLNEMAAAPIHDENT